MAETSVTGQPRYEIDEDILECIIEHAYERGFAWANENPGDGEFLHKAARDYADKTITEYFRPEGCSALSEAERAEDMGGNNDD